MRWLGWGVCCLGLLGCVLIVGCHKRGRAHTNQTTLTAASQAPVEALASSGSGGASGIFPNERINANGKQRAYRLVVPKSLDTTRPAPLVFAFHGLGDSKDLMPLYSQLDQLAEEKGFILVYPNARDKMWVLVPEWARDDLAFFDVLYSHLTERYKIDLNRVYLTGMSNGAYFTHVVGSQRCDKIAAIAAHSGGPGPVTFANLKLTNKYAVLVVHGDQDIVVKVDEGRRTRDMYQRWGHPVEYVELEKHNHFWATKEGINERIWKFFAANPRRPLTK